MVFSVLIICIWGCKRSKDLELKEIFLTKFLYGERIHIDSLVLDCEPCRSSEESRRDSLVIEGFLTIPTKVSLPVSSFRNISNEVLIKLDPFDNIISSYFFDKSDTLLFFAQKDTIQKEWLKNYFLTEFNYYLIVDGQKYNVSSLHVRKVAIYNRNFIEI